MAGKPIEAASATVCIVHPSPVTISDMRCGLIIVGIISPISILINEKLV
jgi:hypothetical protein